MQSREDNVREGLRDLALRLKATAAAAQELFMTAAGATAPSTNVVVVSIDGDVRVYAPNSHNVEVIFIDGDDRDPRQEVGVECRQLEDENHPIYKAYVRVH